ncbi:hypothetical protein ACQ4PT_069941 [Festuca glaucescens]
MGKRKEDQLTDDSSSSSTSFYSKQHRHRHYHNGSKDRTLTLLEIKDPIQDKESMEAKFSRKIEKLKKKRKKDKEDLRILKEHVRILTENIRLLKEGHEYLKSKIKEMRKEGCAEIDHYKASPSQRCRSKLSQSTRFRLVIENSVKTPIYKNETVETNDGGNAIRVILYDGGNTVAPDHPLASAKVDLVVIEGRFNEPNQDSWSKEEFMKSIIPPREGMRRLVKNGTFYLIGGIHDHPGAIITDNSQKKEVKLGVMIAVHTEERVLEGVSNPFKVQEGKTKNRGKHTKFRANDTAEDNRLSYPPVPSTVERNGQASNGNRQNFSQQTPAQLPGPSTSGYQMQHGKCHKIFYFSVYL